ncbi:MAG: acyl-CoA dehydrogenase family protein, partial [Geodermatophilales bacterium]|nr:acyl-CoA dehydrogenase family protein [Geodermatophilales bacterium]
DEEIRPRVREFEDADRYLEDLIEQMKALGFFGLLVPEEHGGSAVSTACFARITEELARGWMSLAGAIGGHSVISYLILTYGTEEQRAAFLPPMADGALRATMALTEPGGGSDLQAMRTYATRVGSEYEIRGSKTWISNARHSGLIGLLCRTDRDAQPPHRGMSVEPGMGWQQMMRGLEVGRIQVASRAVGVAQAALADATRYAQERESFGKPIWQHQSVGNLIADMATRVQAARLLTADAAERLDRGVRADMEAGMAKLFASETAMQVALDAMRVHGGYGYSKEFDVERYFRDAPLMILGEGTNEIQRNVIAAQWISRHHI